MCSPLWAGMHQIFGLWINNWSRTTLSLSTSNVSFESFFVDKKFLLYSVSKIKFCKIRFFGITHSINQVIHLLRKKKLQIKRLPLNCKVFVSIIVVNCSNKVNSRTLWLSFGVLFEKLRNKNNPSLSKIGYFKYYLQNYSCSVKNDQLQF